MNNDSGNAVGLGGFLCIDPWSFSLQVKPRQLPPTLLLFSSDSRPPTTPTGPLLSFLGW